MAEPCKGNEDHRSSPRTYGDLWSPLHVSRKQTGQVKYFPGFPGFSLDFPTGLLLSIYAIALHLFPILSQYGEEVPV
jgi:hypothetical protein